jgi:hypothetical protein
VDIATVADEVAEIDGLLAQLEGAGLGVRAKKVPPPAERGFLIR